MSARSSAGCSRWPQRRWGRGNGRCPAGRPSRRGACWGWGLPLRGRRQQVLARRGAEAGAGARAALAGALLVHHELVDRVVLDKDGSLAVLHRDAQVVVADLDLFHVVVLDGEGIAVVPDHQVRVLLGRLVYGLLDQLSFHAQNSSLRCERLGTSGLFYFRKGDWKEKTPSSSTIGAAWSGRGTEEFEGLGAKGEGPRPRHLPGRLQPQVGAAYLRAALLHAGRHRGLSLGILRLRGLPVHGPRADEPFGPVGGRRGLVDGSRGDQVPLRPRPTLYLGRRDPPPHKDPVLELLSIGPLRHGRRGGPRALRHLPRLRPAPRPGGLSRDPLPRLPRRPLPRGRARRCRHRPRDGGAGARRGRFAIVNRLTPDAGRPR